MKNFFIMIVFLMQLGVVKLAHGKVLACTDEFYLTEVEVKFPDEKNGKIFYESQFLPFPEKWSVAHPSHGKLKIKLGRKNLPAEKLKLEYRSMKGELLATKEIKLLISYQENTTYLTTQDDLDIFYRSFFEKADEGKIQISFVASNKTVCYVVIKILGVEY